MEKERNKINKKLDVLSAPIDKSQLWAKIKSDPQFPGKTKKRRRSFFWLFLLGLMLAGSAMTYWFMKSGGGAERSEAIESVNMTTAQAQSNDVDQKDEEFKNLTIEETDNVDEKILDENEVIDSRDNLYPDAKSNVVLPKNNVSIEYAAIDQITPKINTPATENEVDSFSTNSDDGNSIVDISAPTNLENKSVASSSLPNIFVALLNNINSKKAHQLPIPERDFAYRLNNTEQLLKDKRPWTLSANFGLGCALHSIQGSDLDSFNSVDFRNANTSTLESYLLEAALARQIKWGLDISVGLQYARHFQRFQYTFLEDIIYNRNPPDSEDFYNKAASQTEANYYHTYNLLQLHAAVGKSIAIKNAYFKPSLGAGLNLAGQVKGKLITETLETLDLNSSKSYEPGLIPFLYAEFLFAYPINSRIDIQASAAMKSKFRLTEKSATFTHHLTTFYAKFGLGYHF